MPTGDPFVSMIVVNYLGADDAITCRRSRVDSLQHARDAAHRRKARLKGGDRG
ncbi:hypothetical protein GCM10025762_58120 [Haloechinothrix salitolerans]